MDFRFLYEIYVADYPSSGAVGKRMAVSREEGDWPAWSPDGSTLYFADRANRILAVPFGSDGRPMGEPEVLIDRDSLRTAVFNVLPDGCLLFLERGPREDEIRQLAVILHFDRILKERLP